MQGKSYKMPDDLKKSILFTKSESKRLGRRIKELQQEQNKIENSKKNLEKRKKVL